MQDKNILTKLGAAGLIAIVFGILAGLGGLTHGIGEVQQGNVKPDGLIINSWTTGPIATNMGGEPGMTIVPNLLVTGLLTVLTSLAIIVWSALFIGRQHGGRVMILLSVALLLVGGGFGPPIIGILAGVAGTGIDAPLTGWRRRLPTNLRRVLARSWPWVCAVTILNGVFLVIGSVILVYVFGVDNAPLFTNSFFFAVLSLILTIITGRAYDVENSDHATTRFYDVRQALSS